MAQVFDSKPRQGEQTSVAVPVSTRRFKWVLTFDISDLSDNNAWVNMVAEGLYGTTWVTLCDVKRLFGTPELSNHLLLTSALVFKQPEALIEISEQPSDIRFRITPSKRMRFSGEVTLL